MKTSKTKFKRPLLEIDHRFSPTNSMIHKIISAIAKAVSNIRMKNV